MGALSEGVTKGTLSCRRRRGGWGIQRKVQARVDFVTKTGGVCRFCTTSAGTLAPAKLSLFTFRLCLCPLLVFRLVISCRPSVGLSTGHILELLLPANSNLVPLGLGLRPERMHVCFLIVVLSLVAFSVWPLSTSFLGVYVYTMDRLPVLLRWK